MWFVFFTKSSVIHNFQSSPCKYNMIISLSLHIFYINKYIKLECLFDECSLFFVKDCPCGKKVSLFVVPQNACLLWSLYSVYVFHLNFQPQWFPGRGSIVGTTHYPAAACSTLRPTHWLTPVNLASILRNCSTHSFIVGLSLLFN